jgi:hypothetical protein
LGIVRAKLTGGVAVYGNSKWECVCTSHVEPSNPTVRMNLRRFTRLTNAHNKALKHHRAVQAIFFAFYKALPEA